MAVDLHETARSGVTRTGDACCSVQSGLAWTAGGWALWMTGRWLDLTPEQREVTSRRGHRNGRSGVLRPPPGAPSHTAHSGLGAADGCPGEFRGGKRIAASGALALPTALRAARLHRAPPSNLNLSGASRAPVANPGDTIVTWLILPVVICLSQRLSHACLSISNYTAKLRMAHYISYRLFDSTLLLG